MIIDMLAHIGVKKGEDYKVESLLEIMKEAKVDKCMICSQLETIDNEYIYDCTQRYPDKTIGFAVINPWDIEGEAELEKCFRDYNFYGLKMNAIRFGYSGDRHSVLDPFFGFGAVFYQACQFQGLPKLDKFVSDCYFHDIISLQSLPAESGKYMFLPHPG